MQKPLQLKNGDIESILNSNNIDIEENVDMFLEIVNFKVLYSQYNLYMCTLKDKQTIYGWFILKSSKELINGAVIHITKIKISLYEQKKIINCLNYENVEINQNVTSIKEDVDNNVKINSNIEVEKEIEESDEFLSEELNEDTKLLMGDMKHKTNEDEYFFKYDSDELVLFSEKENKIKETESKQKKNKEFFDTNIFGDGNGNKKELQNEPDSDSNKEIEDDKEEIRKMFEGIKINEIMEINQQRNNQQIDLENKYQLISKLPNQEKGGPLYVKCINKVIITGEKQKYLFVILRDFQGDEICGYVYQNLEAFDKKLIPNDIYVISDYELKKKISSTFINSDCRIIFSNKTIIQTMPNDAIFSQFFFHFLSIAELFYFKQGTIVDVCGVIYDEGIPQITRTKFGLKIIRNILICDDSMKKIYVALWEPHSNNNKIKFEKGEIIAIKYCRLIFYPEKIKKLMSTTFTIIQNSTGDYNKDCVLKEVYEKNKSISNFYCVMNAPDYYHLDELHNLIIVNKKNNVENCNIPFLTMGNISNISIDDNSIYNGCPFCQKKLIEINEDEKENIPESIKFKCIFCKKNFEKPKYIYKLLFQVWDSTGKLYFNILGDEATKFLETEPDIVKEYLEDKNYKQLKNVEKKVMNQHYVFIGKLVSKITRNGRIIFRTSIENVEKAQGEDYKRFLHLSQEEDS